MKFLRKLKARKNGVPFELRKFWPSYYSIMQKGRYDDTLIVVFDAFDESESGKVIPVLEGNGKRHFYKILRTSRLQGSDWGGVSNLAYFLEYSHTVASHQASKEN